MNGFAVGIYCRPCLNVIFLFHYCSTFACLWQILSNYGLTRIKRFVSRFTANCVISFCFHMYLMLHACAAKFDVREKNLKIHACTFRLGGGFGLQVPTL